MSLPQTIDLSVSNPLNNSATPHTIDLSATLYEMGDLIPAVGTTDYWDTSSNDANVADGDPNTSVTNDYFATGGINAAGGITLPGIDLGGTLDVHTVRVYIPSTASPTSLQLYTSIDLDPQIYGAASPIIDVTSHAGGYIDIQINRAVRYIVPYIPSTTDDVNAAIGEMEAYAPSLVTSSGSGSSLPETIVL